MSADADPAAPDLAGLLVHADFVRSLARALVAEDEVDDTVQRTWLAALRRPPSDAASARTWLARTVRNAAADRHRARARREVRERSAARPELEPDPTAGVADLELHRRVVDAAAALDEPYRSAIAARYFDGLGVDAAAARLGIPVETLRTRTRRALAMLRERLDREHGGDRDLWLSGLLPLAWAAPSSSPTRTLLGVATMTVVSKLTIGAALAAAALWLAAPLIRDGGAARSAAPAGDPASAATVEVEPDAGVRPTGEPAAAREVVGSSVEPEVASAPESPYVGGTIVVLDERDVRHAAESGHVVLWSSIIGIGEEHRVPVVDGAWRLDWRPEVPYFVKEIELGGRRALLSERSPDGQVHETDGVELLAWWCDPTWLHVVDAASGAPLSGVTVTRGTRYDQGDRVPASHATVRPRVADVASPVALPGEPGTAWFWIRADGYAWSLAELAVTPGLEHTVGLELGARLEVIVSPDDLEVEAELRLGQRDAEGRVGVVGERDYRSGRRYVFEGLTPGTYRPGIHVGSIGGPQRTLATAWIDLDVGDDAIVTLEPDTTQLAGGSVPLRGTLILPPELDGASPGIELAPHDFPAQGPHDEQRVSGERLAATDEPGVWTFEARDLSPGTYVATVDPMRCWTLLEVGPYGETSARLDFDDLFRLDIRVLDAETGAPRTDASGYLFPPKPSSRTLWRSAFLEVDAETGHLFAWVRPGTVDVNLDGAEDDRSARHTVVLDGATTTIELEL